VKRQVSGHARVLARDKRRESGATDGHQFALARPGDAHAHCQPRKSFFAISTSIVLRSSAFELAGLREQNIGLGPLGLPASRRLGGQAAQPESGDEGDGDSEQAF
jgi:hypothetical protein